MFGRSNHAATVSTFEFSKIAKISAILSTFWHFFFKRSFWSNIGKILQLTKVDSDYDADGGEGGLRPKCILSSFSNPLPKDHRGHRGHRGGGYTIHPENLTSLFMFLYCFSTFYPAAGVFFCILHSKHAFCIKKINQKLVNG